MTRYRQIHTKIWKDDWFLELEPLHKLFYIYLFSNERASIAGIYELSKRVMSFEAGLLPAEIDDAFKVFGTANKAWYRDGVVLIPNLRKYHESKSPKVQAAIQSDLKSIKDTMLKDWYCKKYSIDTVSVQYQGTVSIESNSSSSSSSSSSGYSFSLEDGGLGEETESRLLTALASIAKETYAIGHPNAIKYDVAIGVLAEVGATPEQVEGFGPYWKKNGWNKNPKPWLTNITDHWDDYLANRNLRKDGSNAQSTDDKLAAAMALED